MKCAGKGWDFKKQVIFLWKIEEIFKREDEKNCLPIEEYEGKGDIGPIMKYFRLKKGEMSLKVMLCFVCAVLLIAVGIILDKKIEFTLNSPLFSSLYLYLVINILAVIILILAEAKDIYIGLINIARFRPNSESIIFLGSLGAVLQSISAFFLKSEIESGSFSLHTSVFGIAVFLDIAGKYYNISRIKNNFRFLISAKEKFSIRKIEGKKALEKSFDILASKKSTAVYQGRTEQFRDFIRLSYMRGSNDSVISKIAIVNIIGVIAGIILSAVIDKSFVSFVQTFTLLSCLCAPISNIFIASKCVWRCCRKLNKNKAMMVGYSAVNKFKGVTYAAFNANEVYRKGCVKIKGIRAFGDQHIDNVLLYAAAVSNSLESTLNGVFEKAFSSKRIKVPKASNVEYESYMGMTGWVNGKRILVGNRELLKKHKVYPPSQVFEHKCCGKGQRAVYVAVGRELAAMFIVAYKPSRETVNDIKAVAQNGIKLLIGSNDSCITEEVISSDFGIPISAVQIVKNVGDSYDNDENSDFSDSDSIITSEKGIKPFFKGLLSCINLRYIVHMMSAIEAAACLIGIITAMVLIMSKGIMQVGTIEFLLFTVFWQISMYIVSYICGT